MVWSIAAALARFKDFGTNGVGQHRIPGAIGNRALPADRAYQAPGSRQIGQLFHGVSATQAVGRIHAKQSPLVIVGVEQFLRDDASHGLANAQSIHAYLVGDVRRARDSRGHPARGIIGELPAQAIIDGIAHGIENAGLRSPRHPETLGVIETRRLLEAP